MTMSVVAWACFLIYSNIHNANQVTRKKRLQMSTTFQIFDIQLSFFQLESTIDYTQWIKRVSIHYSHVGLTLTTVCIRLSSGKTRRLFWHFNRWCRCWTYEDGTLFRHCAQDCREFQVEKKRIQYEIYAGTDTRLHLLDRQLCTGEYK